VGKLARSDAPLRSQRQCSLHAGARWLPFPHHTDVAAEMTNSTGTEECFRALGKRTTYASESESSVSRLLATLLCRPSESSL
jgi:hypothetical protein